MAATVDPRLPQAAEPAVPGTARRAVRRFALAAFVLLAATLVWFGASSLLAMDEQRDRETSVRVALVANQLAERIAFALRVGVPLEALTGVEEMFERTRTRDRNIEGIELQGASDRALHAVGMAGSGGLRVRAAVKVEGRAVATVVVRYRAADFGARFVEGLVLQGAALLLLVALAAEAARYALEVGWRLRDRIVFAMARETVSGRYTRLYVGAARRAHDLRTVGLGTAVARVNEHHMRVRRLVDSLRQTEPNAKRRRILDRLLHQATGADVFAERAPDVVQIRADAARWRWIVLLAACSAGALRVLAHGDSPAAPLWGSVLLAAAQCAGLAWLGHCARRWPTRVDPFVQLAPGLIALGIVLSAPDAHPYWSWAATLIAGAGLGLALGAAARLRFAADAGGDPVAGHADLAAPLLAVAFLGIDFLGPVLALLAREALGPGACTILFAAMSVAALLVGLGAARPGTDLRGVPMAGAGRATAPAPAALRKFVYVVSGCAMGVLLSLPVAGVALAGGDGLAWQLAWWSCMGLGLGWAVSGRAGTADPAQDVRRVAILAMLGATLLLASDFLLTDPVPAGILTGLALVFMAHGWWSLAHGMRALVEPVHVAGLAAGFATHALCAWVGIDPLLLASPVLLILAAALAAAVRRLEL